MSDLLHKNRNKLHKTEPKSMLAWIFALRLRLLKVYTASRFYIIDGNPGHIYWKFLFRKMFSQKNVGVELLLSGFIWNTDFCENQYVNMDTYIITTIKELLILWNTESNTRSPLFKIILDNIPFSFISTALMTITFLFICYNKERDFVLGKLITNPIKPTRFDRFWSSLYR